MAAPVVTGKLHDSLLHWHIICLLHDLLHDLNNMHLATCTSSPFCLPKEVLSLPSLSSALSQGCYDSYVGEQQPPT